jgi:hypothetical protein
MRACTTPEPNAHGPAILEEAVDVLARFRRPHIDHVVNFAGHLVVGPHSQSSRLERKRRERERKGKFEHPSNFKSLICRLGSVANSFFVRNCLFSTWIDEALQGRSSMGLITEAR